jgi:hypothetical protein
LSFWIVGCFKIAVGLQEVRVRSRPAEERLLPGVRPTSGSSDLRKRKLPQAAIRGEHDDQYAALTQGARLSRKKPFCLHPRTQSSFAGFTDNLEDGYANITPFVFCVQMASMLP